MRWRRTDPVQAVGALLAAGREEVARTLAAMERKSALLRGLPAAQGEGWLAIFAAPVSGDSSDADDRILPRLQGPIALHEAAPGWWAPVGVVLEAPEHAQAALWAALATDNDVAPPAIVAPRFAPGAVSTAEADVYLVGSLAPLTTLLLASAAPAPSA